MRIFGLYVCVVALFAVAGPALAASQDDAAVYSQTKDRGRGIVSCTRVLQRSGETAENRAIAYYKRGIAYKAKGDNDRAIADYNEAIRLDPKLAAAYHERGIAYKAKGDNDYEKAIELDHRWAAYQGKMDDEQFAVDKFDAGLPGAKASLQDALIALDRARSWIGKGSGQSSGRRASHLCSEKYQAAKAAGTLNGEAWPQFYSRCAAETKANPPAAEATPPRAAPAPAAPVVGAPPAPPGPNNELTKMSLVGNILQSLPMGNIFLEAPRTMKVKEVRGVEARVGVNVPMEILRRRPAAGAQRVEGSLRASSEMSATLSSPGFKITATTPEQQTVAEGFPTVWQWNVEAMQDGDQELTATLYALVPDGEKAYRQRIEHEISQ